MKKKKKKLYKKAIEKARRQSRRRDLFSRFCLLLEELIF